MKTTSLDVGPSPPTSPTSTSKTSPASTSPTKTSPSKTSANNVYPDSPPISTNATDSDRGDVDMSDGDTSTESVKLEGQTSPNGNSLASSRTGSSESHPSKPEHPDSGQPAYVPHHYSGNVPVFQPTMDEFADFQAYMTAINDYGMEAGIVKVVAPREWRDNLPNVADKLQTLRIKQPIRQEIIGTGGHYRQINVEHPRSYSIPQWRRLCQQSDHQPPAPRGQRRAGATATPPTRARRTRSKKNGEERADITPSLADITPSLADITPSSAEGEPATSDPSVETTQEDATLKEAILKDTTQEPEPAKQRGRMGGVSTRPAESSPKKTRTASTHASKAQVPVTEEDWQIDTSAYTEARCEELEHCYWKTLTFASPMYGADLQGSLFDDTTTSWNLSKLPNLLNVLGDTVPGVNSAYLYMGMWKATFAWHVEDVDLYSINYLHFGAPKQWYAIGQSERPRFEQAMRQTWSADAKLCDQFLRHKAFIMSPQRLASQFGVRVNKVVSYPGEFVVTYPYGYHAGFNLGYNCAEAVNFALESWFPIGKAAKHCTCSLAQDSVWMNVAKVERLYRGEPDDSSSEEEDELEELEELEEMEEMEERVTPKTKRSGRPKRKDAQSKAKSKKAKVQRGKGDKVNVKNLRCCICTRDFRAGREGEMLETDHGKACHRWCAALVPETVIHRGKEKKARETVLFRDPIAPRERRARCALCDSKKGTCIKCVDPTCSFVAHPTCAVAAGMYIEEVSSSRDGPPSFHAFCRLHRKERAGRVLGEATPPDGDRVAQLLKPGDVCQFQEETGEIVAGCVVANRLDRRQLLVQLLFQDQKRDMSYSTLLVPARPSVNNNNNNSDSVSPAALPKIPPAVPGPRPPLRDGPAQEQKKVFEVSVGPPVVNRDQTRPSLLRDAYQVWHYVGGVSTDTKARYTHEPAKATRAWADARALLDSITSTEPELVTRHARGQLTPVVDTPYVYKPRRAGPGPVTFPLALAHDRQYAAHGLHHPNQARPNMAPPTTHHHPMTHPMNHPTQANHRFVPPPSNPSWHPLYTPSSAPPPPPSSAPPPPSSAYPYGQQIGSMMPPHPSYGLATASPVLGPVSSSYPGPFLQHPNAASPPNSLSPAQHRPSHNLPPRPPTHTRSFAPQHHQTSLAPAPASAPAPAPAPPSSDYPAPSSPLPQQAQATPTENTNHGPNTDQSRPDPTTSRHEAAGDGATRPSDSVPGRWADVPSDSMGLVNTVLDNLRRVSHA